MLHSPYLQQLSPARKGLGSFPNGSHGCSVQCWVPSLAELQELMQELMVMLSPLYKNQGEHVHPTLFH